ncbi:transporter associated with antigen processing protein 1 [Artemisia annua]|uniref:Transporter associated with antigen processing protein 1 n=1 Tax=Artemisia annua TaxID=35608 RepID=A0A2U1KQ92_ARTAN|nr:transporter associated with antigen processing protein 1 [Artemisia annua]
MGSKTYREISTDTIEVKLFLIIGGMSTIVGHITAEQLAKFVLYNEWLIYSTWFVGDNLSSLMQSVGASEKVFQIMYFSPTDRVEVASLKGRIEFRSVSFSYSSMETKDFTKFLSAYDHVFFQPGACTKKLAPTIAITVDHCHINQQLLTLNGSKKNLEFKVARGNDRRIQQKRSEASSKLVKVNSLNIRYDLIREWMDKYKIAADKKWARLLRIRKSGKDEMISFTEDQKSKAVIALETGKSFKKAKHGRVLDSVQVFLNVLISRGTYLQSPLSKIVTRHKSFLKGQTKRMSIEVEPSDKELIKEEEETCGLHMIYLSSMRL